MSEEKCERMNEFPRIQTLSDSVEKRRNARHDVMKFFSRNQRKEKGNSKRDIIEWYLQKRSSLEILSFDMRKMFIV